MASEAVTAPAKSALGETQRRDAWWAGPLATALGLGAFVVYATFRAFYNADFVVDYHGGGELLSPFYSPLIKPAWMPVWISPAILILWAPGGFRVTCYYYRKAYYRAYFLDPPACGVGEPRNVYRGETHLLLFQNLHRYFLYVALVFLVFLALDVARAAILVDDLGYREFGVTVGTLVLAANVTLLGLYTFSCHSLRHLVGGNIDCFSCAAFGQGRYRLWRGASRLNKNHMLWAWASLFMVGFADFYVWMVAAGRITDFRLL